MEKNTPITVALARLQKLDEQLERGQITREDLETQRLIVLIDVARESVTRERN